MLKKGILITSLLVLSGCSSIEQDVDMLTVLNESNIQYKNMNLSLDKYCIDEQGQLNHLDTIRVINQERFLCSKDRVSWVREPIKRKY